MKRAPLDPALAKELGSIGKADIVVGIPSWNNARTIGHVVAAVVAGLRKYLPDLKSIVVNSDGGSRDGTQDAVLKAAVDEKSLLLTRHPVHPVHRLTTPYMGIPGKGSALRTIFQVAADLDARACAVFDSDLRSITPEWVELLLLPIISQGYDYVAPYYTRHKFDGTITNNIVYPLTRSLYGRAIRQPIGGDFGFSGSLIRSYLAQDVWDSDVARFGIDIWLTTVAIAEGYKVCQSYLGAKVHDPKDPGADLSEMLVQVVGSVFDLMETYETRWPGINGSAPVPLFGFHFEVTTEPIRVDVQRMRNGCARGITELKEIYDTVIRDRQMRSRLDDCLDQGLQDDDLWAGLICEFAVAQHARRLPRSHLLKSLTPLYLGRVASFVSRHQESSSAHVEADLEELCGCFARMKPALVRKWTDVRNKGGIS